MSSGIVLGSLSVLSSGVGGVLLAGVFHGTEISLTECPSTDSVAETVNSCDAIGIRSPASVWMYLRPLGSVIDPETWNRLRR